MAPPQVVALVRRGGRLRELSPPRRRDPQNRPSSAGCDQFRRFSQLCRHAEKIKVNGGKTQYCMCFEGGSFASNATAEKESHEDNGSSAESASSKEQRDREKAAMRKRMLCSKEHRVHLRNQVYDPECSELKVNPNSGVKKLLANCDPCFCWLESVSFKNHLLGDRGVLGLLPLLKFCRTLKSLNLAGNGLRSEGLGALVSEFKTPGEHLGLCVLDLSHNPIHGKCFDEILRLVMSKRNLLLFGVQGTTLNFEQRQRLLRQALSNFDAADLAAKREAWEIADSGEYFSDRELWLRASQILGDIEKTSSPSSRARSPIGKNEIDLQQPQGRHSSLLATLKRGSMSITEDPSSLPGTVS